MADTGVGIPPEFLDRVFERFAQADASLSRKFGGLGLGLSIAKHLSELHGGSLRAKSAGPGQGATFCLQLPLLPVQDPERIESDRRSAEVDEGMSEGDLAGVTALVVDDDPDSAGIIARILRKKGASVRVANSMEAALQELERSTPSVLLSDIGMPSHDGYELIQRVRAMPNGKRIAAVALTALARAEDRTRSLRAGFSMHVAKPVDSAELIAVVRNLANLSTPH